MIQTTLRALALTAGIALPAHADTIAVAAPWEISSLDPAVAGYAFLRMAAAETLVEVDDDGALAPGLARDWSVSGNGLTWTFTLRENVRFHDDTALNAEAAADALNRALPLPGVLVNAPIETIAAEGEAAPLSSSPMSRPRASIPPSATRSPASSPAPSPPATPC